MNNQELEELWDTKLSGWAWQIREEFLELLRIMQQKEIKKVLEIGCYEGGSAAGFLAIGCRVVSIDITRTKRVDSLIKNPGLSTFRFIDRAHIAQNIDAFYAKYDLLFIDGDHSYKNCKKDYEEFSSEVKPGGMIVFHDICSSELHRRQGCQVDKFWIEIRGEDYDEIVTNGEWGGIGIKYL